MSAKHKTLKTWGLCLALLITGFYLLDLVSILRIQHLVLQIGQQTEVQCLSNKAQPDTLWVSNPLLDARETQIPLLVSDHFLKKNSKKLTVLVSYLPGGTDQLHLLTHSPLFGLWKILRGSSTLKDPFWIWVVDDPEFTDTRFIWLGIVLPIFVLLCFALYKLRQ